MTKPKAQLPPRSQERGGVVQHPAIANEWQSLDTVKEEAAMWFWRDRILGGTVTILEGRKGSGKSTLAAAMAAAVTGGPRLPDQRGLMAPQAVLWIGTEESTASAVVPRLRAAGAQTTRCYRPPVDDRTGMPRRIQLPGDTGFLADTIGSLRVGLVICDPWTSCVSPSVDMHQEAAIRGTLEPLAQIADDADCVILLIRHLRKSGRGGALDQGLGGVGVGNIARSILRADRHPDKKGVYTLSVVGCNRAPNTPTLEWSLRSVGEERAIDWGSTSALDADDLAEAGADRSDRSVRRDAYMLLISMLGAGWRPCREIFAERDDAGISQRTLERAKEDLGVVSRRVTHGLNAMWEWGPPPAGWPEEWAPKVTDRCASSGSATSGKPGRGKAPRSSNARPAAPRGPAPGPD